MKDLDALLAKYKAAGLTLATAESCTGGLLAAALTQIAGASAVFERGYVTYSWDAKISDLGVPRALLEENGAVSEAVAAAMAQGARIRSGASLALATTGVAGPGPAEGQPEGRICFAIASATDLRSMTLDFGAIGRSNVRVCAVEYAIGLLQEHIDACRRVL